MSQLSIKDYCTRIAILEQNIAINESSIATLNDISTKQMYKILDLEERLRKLYKQWSDYQDRIHTFTPASSLSVPLEPTHHDHSVQDRIRTPMPILAASIQPHESTRHIPRATPVPKVLTSETHRASTGILDLNASIVPMLQAGASIFETSASTVLVGSYNTDDEDREYR